MSSAMVASCTSRERTDSKIAKFLVDPGGPLLQDFHNAGIRHEHGVTRLQGTLRAMNLSAGGQSSRAHTTTGVIFDDTFPVPLQEFISEDVDDSRRALCAWGVSESLCADGAWVPCLCAEILQAQRRLAQTFRPNALPRSQWDAVDKTAEAHASSVVAERTEAGAIPDVRRTWCTN